MPEVGIPMRIRGRSLRRSAWLLAVVSLVVTAAAIGAGAWALVRLADARGDVVDQADPALVNVEALARRLVDQESAVRGYVATGDPEFLEPYPVGVTAAGQRISDIERIATEEDDASLQRWVGDIEAAAQTWRSEYAEPAIAAVRSGTAGPPAELGEQRFDAVRSTLELGRSALTADREDARDRLDETATALGVICAGAALGVVLLLVSIAFWARRTVIAPMLRLGAEVRTVTGTNFDHRVHGDGPRELIELAQDIETMRRRIVEELVLVQELNRTLDERTYELERSNSDLEQFAYVASHDLQEPLRKVSSFCELLSKRYKGKLDDRADQYIDFAVDGARRMSVLINDLLAFSRVGRTGIHLEPVAGREILDQALHNLGDLPERTGTRITADDLPEVEADAALLTTVFQNLIGNAIKFRGDAPPHIRITVEDDGDHWHFRFSDNGIGIDPAYADKVFVIFQRLHPKEAYPGTGIGLALCRKIVEFHGGRIWLDPEVSEGATFHLTLPRPAGPETTAEPVPVTAEGEPRTS